MNPEKQKKRYIILTLLEKYDGDKTVSANSIAEEIEAENDKTHYPFPLNLIEITNAAQIR